MSRKPDWALRPELYLGDKAFLEAVSVREAERILAETEPPTGALEDWHYQPIRWMFRLSPWAGPASLAEALARFLSDGGEEAGQ